MARDPRAANADGGGGKTFLTLLFVGAVVASPYLTQLSGGNGGDGKWQPGEIVSVVAVCGIIVTGIMYVLAPFFRERLREIRRSDPKALLEDFLYAVDCDPKLAKDGIAALFPEEASRREHAYAASLDHGRQLAEIKASGDQTVTLVGALKGAVSDLTAASVSLTAGARELRDEIRELRREQGEHGKSIAGMGATIAAWTGEDRRHGDRRGTGHPGGA